MHKWSRLKPSLGRESYGWNVPVPWCSLQAMIELLWSSSETPTVLSESLVVLICSRSTLGAQERPWCLEWAAGASGGCFVFFWDKVSCSLSWPWIPPHPTPILLFYFPSAAVISKSPMSEVFLNMLYPYLLSCHIKEGKISISPSKIRIKTSNISTTKINTYRLMQRNIDFYFHRVSILEYNLGFTFM